MKIRDLTKIELDKFRDLCNFTPSELDYFNLKSRDFTNAQVAEVMNVSEAQVAKLAKRVKKKMNTVANI